MRGASPSLGQAKAFAEWPTGLKTALTLLLSSEAQIVMFVGPDFLAFYNDAYALALGDKHPRALGAPAREAWSELWEDLGGLLSHVYRTGETISERDRRFYVERHGYPETVYFDISFSALRGCDGTVQAVFCIVSETTSRVEALRSLREQDSRLRAVLTSMPAGLCTLNHAGTLVTTNQHFADMMGETQRALIGRNLRDLVDPRDWQDDWLDRRHAEAAQGTEDVRYLRSDGEQICVEQSISLIEDSREPQGWAFCLLTTDITERRRKESELRRMAGIIEGSDDAILGMDLEMKVTSWNAGAERLYGWRASEMIGQSVLRLLPPGRSDEEARILDRIRAGGRVEHYQTTRLSADGREVPISLAVSPIYDDCGEIIGASKIARNISVQIEAARMQEYLLFEMKHRVKNILATVLALARQAFGRLDLPEYAVFTRRVHALAQSQDLLTRRGQGDISAAELIAEVLSPFSSDRFTIEGPPISVPGETVLSITLALHELVTNALKYGALSVPDGEVAIRWRIHESGPGSLPRVHLTWKESGGPRITAPGKRGFGSVLIRDLLASTLQAEISLTYPPDGAEFSADFPLKSAAREESVAKQPVLPA